MKKTIALILGLTLLSAGSVLLQSFASRDAYHAYLISKQASDKGFRTFSEGRTVRLKERLRQIKAEARTARGTYRGQNLRYSQENTRSVYRLSDSNPNLKIRTSTDAIRSSGWNAPLRRQAVVASNIKDQDVLMETYENETFSIQIPKAWQNSEEDSHTFKNTENDFVVNIKKLPASSCSNIQGFGACAIALSRTENKKAVTGAGGLLPSSRVVRQSQTSDTFLNRPDLRTSTFTESFAAYVPSVGDQLINRYFVSDLDGGVYVIETTSSVYLAKDNIKVSKKIFDSFRIYPQD